MEVELTPVETALIVVQARNQPLAEGYSWIHAIEPLLAYLTEDSRLPRDAAQDRHPPDIRMI
ncbi:hypothetical protein XpopCFBP1817_04275 [Xanthomonas populi]|uniref:Uncharacterized protein n=1 Tax=Xanthomonas populi TaxID=53414 RepID=A0A2S7EYX4_9XANT|nr:hypothetical protein XpopCFBP1817_04275 [Xanthomonas populi]